MASPYRLQWGIMATGWIAKTFSKDLLLSPPVRDVHDIEHKITAVASSSSVVLAETFVNDIVTPEQQEPRCNAYGSYAEMAQDPDIDVIYVATPHSRHFQDVILCLNAGKAVLCEKPLTVNAHQARLLYDLARKKNVFLMEAVWTRCFPISIEIRQHVEQNTIGEILRASADLSHILEKDQWQAEHRLINKNLAGGCLMDIGPYPLLWIMQTMWHTLPRDQQKEKPQVVGTTMTKDSRTGVDTMTSLLIEFPRSAPTGDFKAHGIASAGFQVTSDPDGNNTAGPAIRLYGTTGEIQVFAPIFRPERYRIILHSGKIIEKTFEIPDGGHGMFWEADEVARCLRIGKLESDVIPWDESILVMELMDAARKKGGLDYPSAIENVDV